MKLKDENYVISGGRSQRKSYDLIKKLAFENEMLQQEIQTEQAKNKHLLDLQASEDKELEELRDRINKALEKIRFIRNNSFPYCTQPLENDVLKPLENILGGKDG